LDNDEVTQAKPIKVLSLVILLLFGIVVPVTARELHSYAIVQDDGSLLIKGRQVHLFGIYLPETSRHCRRNILPVRCGGRAVLALDFKVQGFVHCYPQSENDDGSLNGICYVDRSHFKEGVDLGAYLIERGWALALPDAPFEYHALERIARHNNRGVWGFTVDSFR
jgi:endonuclease YncB( thermonuclease family)